MVTHERHPRQQQWNLLHLLSSSAKPVTKEPALCPLLIATVGVMSPPASAMKKTSFQSLKNQRLMDPPTILPKSKRLLSMMLQ